MVILIVVVQIKFFSTQLFEDYFKVVATQITMTRTPASNWTHGYVDVSNTTKVQRLICRKDFARKNSRMLSHLGYIPSTSIQDSNVRFYKNVKLDVLYVFCGCGGIAPDLSELTES